jgi:hypothetical protein
MRWVHEDRVLCPGVDPALKYVTAWENERVDTSGVNHSQLQVTIKRGGRYGLPSHFDMMGPIVLCEFDSGQLRFAHADNLIDPARL